MNFDYTISPTLKKVAINLMLVAVLLFASNRVLSQNLTKFIKGIPLNKIKLEQNFRQPNLNYISRNLEKNQNLDRLQNKICKHQKRWELEEQKLRRNFNVSDNYGDYNALLIKIENPLENKVLIEGAYIAKLDTLLSYLRYHGIEKDDSSLIVAFENSGKMIKVLENYKLELQKRVDKWKYFISKANLNESNFQREFSKFEGEIDFIRILEAKARESFNETTNQEKALLNQIGNDPGFNEYMKKHGALSKYLNVEIPTNNQTLSLQGLQTVQNVQNIVSAGFGDNLRNLLDTEIEEAAQAMGKANEQAKEITRSIDSIGKALSKDSLRLLKNKLWEKEKNEFKALAIKERFKLGWNYQINPGRSSIPAVYDLGGTLLYLASPKIRVGAGIGYKMSLGTWEKIEFKSIGLLWRTNLDYRISKSLFLTVEYGHEYLKGIQMNSYTMPKKLAGLYKELSFRNKKLLLKILYDFDNRINPIVFRTEFLRN